jgi:hypothetical protein
MDIATLTCTEIASAKKFLSDAEPDLCMSFLRLREGDGL